MEKYVHVKFEVVSVNEVDVTTQIVSNQNISVAHGCHGHTHEGVRMIRRHYFDKVSSFHTPAKQTDQFRQNTRKSHIQTLTASPTQCRLPIDPKLVWLFKCHAVT